MPQQIVFRDPLHETCLYEMKRIHDSLRQVLHRNRLVFWYDSAGDWTDAFEAFSDENVTKLRVAGNDFGTKVRVVREPDPEAKFLIYVTTARPPDGGNWLLDLLLQGYEFKADKASLALHEAGLRAEFRALAEEHAAFFKSDKRTQALKAAASGGDEIREIRLKMMAILAETEAEIDALMLHFLAKAVAGATMDLFDPVLECLSAAALTGPFWREADRIFGYNSATPSLRDFAVLLFRGANPLDTEVALHPHARVFLRRWKDSQKYCESFQVWSGQMEREMQIEGALDRADTRAKLGDSDTFEIFERFTLHRLCQSFEKGAAATDIRAVIQQRRGSFWFEGHQHGYAALEQAVEMRELLASAELTVDSVASGVNRYMASWWRIDMAYRLCTLHLRRYGHLHVMKQVTAWLEKTYVNDFLLVLADRWSDQVRRLETWECEVLPAQTRFFEVYVRPFLRRNQKIVVIVSDALRFEAATDFAQRLRAANRWTAEVDALFGCLPSFTQLGMASLLPGIQWSLDPRTGAASVDGRSATGTPARAEILQASGDWKASARSAEQFLELNTKTDGRELMRENEVIYIFHNHIDKVGDAAGTEGKTVDAVEDAFAELEKIIHKVANINGNNMLLTADHGFLFQQDDVATGDFAALPAAEEWTYPAQRFALGRGIADNAAIKVFSAGALGLSGDWSAAFPLSLGRFPRPGSGKRYVHGGISLQEIVVPVVKIHKARVDDTDRVEVELLRVPAKITTGQVSISLFQDKAAVDKVLPRTLRAGVYAGDNVLISELKTMTFDSKDQEARQRERSLSLVLSHAADAFNGQEVELRLEAKVPGSEQFITYRAHTVKLQKPFAMDFDEL
jgi:uncharacterized protein (TIGR02687 family)